MRDDSADPAATRLLAWQEVLPTDACWTHLTAARLLGWWLPPLPRDTPEFIAYPGRIRRPGMAVHRVATEWRSTASGLRIAKPSEVLFSCARDLGELDLVCLTSAALSAGHTTKAELIETASRSGRGVRNLRRAIDRADPRYESIWEILLAELHRDTGIDIDLQHTVLTPAGAFVARGDVWLRGTRTLHEYDGAGHREKEQHQSDLRRDRRIIAAGWRRRGYISTDILRGARQILAEADEAIGRRHDPANLKPWFLRFNESLFCPQKHLRWSGNNA